MSKYLNPDGRTYDGTRIMSDLTGGVISPAEVKWTFGRLKELMQAGMSKERAVATVREESKARPWELRPCP